MWPSRTPENLRVVPEAAEEGLCVVDPPWERRRLPLPGRPPAPPTDTPLVGLAADLLGEEPLRPPPWLPRGVKRGGSVPRWAPWVEAEAVEVAEPWRAVPEAAGRYGCIAPPCRAPGAAEAPPAPAPESAELPKPLLTWLRAGQAGDSPPWTRAPSAKPAAAGPQWSMPPPCMRMRAATAAASAPGAPPAALPALERTSSSLLAASERADAHPPSSLSPCRQSAVSIPRCARTDHPTPL